MRFIKLPAIEMDDISEQVGLEAQQHIPFPMEDIVYSYQELGERDGEREVLLVAIKKDVLDNLNTQVEGNNVRTVGVDCSITSLYNAFRASYPEDAEESVMLLDIGAKTTDIIFAEAGRFFTRSVTAAGAFITNSIAREFNLSFREAEKNKLEYGMVSLGSGHTEELDPQTAAMAGTIRNAMGRLCSEVQRTINHYRAQYQGTPPTKVYICGGGARLQYALEYLQATLNLPVDFLNPLGCCGVSSKVDEEALEDDALCLGSLVGAVITGAGTGEFSIDLVPTSVGKDRAEKKMLPLVAAGGVIALAGAGFYAYVASDAAAEAEAALSRALPADERVASISSQIESTQGKYSSEMKKLEEFADIYNARYAYAELLKQLSFKAASIKFWFTEFSPLINYDVANTTLVADSDVKGVRLIDMSRSRSGSSESAMNRAPDAVNPKDRNKAPRVTAIYVSGYTTKKPGDERSTDQRQALYNLVANNFDERSADSLFSYVDAEVQKNLNHYFQFIDSKATKGKMPDYVERFMMVMPLKNPIVIPELSGDKK